MSSRSRRAPSLDAGVAGDRLHDRHCRSRAVDSSIGLLCDLRVASSARAQPAANAAEHRAAGETPDVLRRCCRGMSDETPAATGVEALKAESNYLRDPLVAEFAAGGTHITDDGYQILKFHGSYQQDDRDQRNERRKAGEEYAYGFMIRLRIPGGDVHPGCGWRSTTWPSGSGSDTLRLTTRQSIQLHFIPKADLRTVIRTVNERLASTLGACGDVNRNVMAAPLPLADAALPRPCARPRSRDLGAPAAEHPRLRRAVAGRRGGRPGRAGRWRADRGGAALRQDLPAAQVQDLRHGRRRQLGRPVHPRPRARPASSRTARSRAGTSTSAAAWAGPTASPTRSRAWRTRWVRRRRRPAPRRRGRRHRPARLGRPDEPAPRAAQVHDRTTAGIDWFRGEVEEVTGLALAAGPRGRLGPLRRPARAGTSRATAAGSTACASRTAASATATTAPDALGAAGDRGRARHRLPRSRPTRTSTWSTCPADGRGPVDSLLADHGVAPGDRASGCIRRLAMACPALPTCGLAVTEAERALAGVARRRSRRCSTRSGVGDAVPDRAHDRLPQRLRPAVRGGDRPRRRRRRPLPGLARRRLAPAPASRPAVAERVHKADLPDLLRPGAGALPRRADRRRGARRLRDRAGITRLEYANAPRRRRRPPARQEPA